MIRLRSGFLAALATAVTAVAPFAAPAAASGAPSLQRGFAEGEYESGDDAVRNYWFDQTAAAEGTIVRLNVPWDHVAATKPASPKDPADPVYDFSEIDRGVTSAAAHGQQVILTVFGAPSWAAGGHPPNGADLSTWKPDPRAFGDFGAALARRYSGSYNPGTGVLPRVRYYEAWNEPNLSDYITPQYEGNREVAAVEYRSLVNAFYAGVKSADRGAKVIAGATAPFGDDPPNAFRTRPLRFLREFFCLRGDLHHLRPKPCPHKPKFDILSHHPITLGHDPHYSAISPWDATTADFHNVAALLHAAERRGTLGTSGHHPLWATELWWESKPPDPQGVSVQRQARWLEDAMYLLWRQGAKTLIWFQLVDGATAQGGGGQQSGLFYDVDQRKPAFTAFRFPFVTERRGGRVAAWAIPPASGQVRIQRKSGGGWRTIAHGAGHAGRAFSRTLTVPGSATLRAVVGGEQSLAWWQAGSRSHGGGRSWSPPRAGAGTPRELRPYAESR